MEESSWIEAAVKVLIHADQPMHYVDIKRVILEMGLVPSEWVFKEYLYSAILYTMYISKRSLCSGMDHSFICKYTMPVFLCTRSPDGAIP